jgi:hypothetical protein
MLQLAVELLDTAEAEGGQHQPIALLLLLLRLTNFHKEMCLRVLPRLHKKLRMLRRGDDPYPAARLAAELEAATSQVTSVGQADGARAGVGAGPPGASSGSSGGGINAYVVQDCKTAAVTWSLPLLTTPPCNTVGYSDKLLSDQATRFSSSSVWGGQSAHGDRFFGDRFLGIDFCFVEGVSLDSTMLLV